MLIINFSDALAMMHVNCDNSCVSRAVQLVYSADTMWWYEAICAFWLMLFAKLRLTESFQII